MSGTFPAYRKLTNRYRPAYSYLDEQQYMGFHVKVVYGKARRQNDNHDGRVSHVLYLTTSRPVTRNELEDCLHEFDRGCACEHDCCGHLSGGPDYSLVKGNHRGTKWQVPVNYRPAF